MNEPTAVNVKQEAADVYYKSFGELPDRVKKRVSAEMLSEVFRCMVVPAIDEVRRLDRGGELRRERPCTCHPADNPPVPCAQRYALQDCKAESRRRLTHGTQT